MKAIVCHNYGSPDVLKLEEVKKPAPADDEVLIRIHAVSVNRSDWEMLRGKPLYARIGGLLKPRHRILGSDIAGRVEMAGRNSRQFQPGDEVFGDIIGRMGGFAEYVCACGETMALKPAGMTFEQAAAIPQAAVIALQGICESRTSFSFRLQAGAEAQWKLFPGRRFCRYNFPDYVPGIMDWENHWQENTPPGSSTKSKGFSLYNWAM